MKNLLPTSRAKTAYGLLAAICKLIVAEPKRYNQDYYLISNNNKPESFLAERWRAAGRMPACGTVGCVAGWAVQLKFPEQAVGIDRLSNTAMTAREMLGLSSEQGYDLFDHTALGKVAKTEAEIAALVAPGTEAYAALGVKHIRQFMAANKQQLKAKRID